MDINSDSPPPSEARALDLDLDVDPPTEASFPPTEASFDFFLRVFFGISGKSEGCSFSTLGSLRFRLVLEPSNKSLVPFREDRLDCLGLSDFSLLGDSAEVPFDERRLDGFGNSGKSRSGEFCDPTGEPGAPA